jgi:hypothetical protein
LADDEIAIIVPKQWNLNDFHDRFFFAPDRGVGECLRNIGFCLTLQSKNSAGVENPYEAPGRVDPSG